MIYSIRHRQNTEIMSMLLEKADVQGYLTTEDLMEFYPEGDDDSEHLSALMIALRRRGVDILDHDNEFSLQEEDPLPPSDFDPYSDLERISIDDTVGLYLKEMSRVPLLNIEEEMSLAQRIEAGRAAKKEMHSCGRVDQERRHALDNTIQDGISAREHLIKANTRLVVSIAKKYIGRGVPFLDLIQEGNLGLMKAVEKYDYHKGFRFYNLCNMVDPANYNPLNCRSGKNNQGSGTYD